METLPYEPYSVRSKRAWQEIAEILNLHPVIIREAYINKYYQYSSSFFDYIKSGKISYANIIEAAEDFLEMPDIELDRRQKEWDKCSLENDFCDLMNYRLKDLIEVGDYLVSDETKTFCFSGKQYQTKGKKYKIIELNDDRDGKLTGIHAITDADIKGETIHWCEYGMKSLWRNEKEIWNWQLAYLALHKEQNPNHPQTPELEEQCIRNAKLMAKGEKTN